MIVVIGWCVVKAPWLLDTVMALSGSKSAFAHLASLEKYNYVDRMSRVNDVSLFRIGPSKAQHLPIRQSYRFARCR